LRRNLITVPSCDEHNGAKSGDDQHLMHVLAMSLPSGAAGQNHFATKVLRSAQRRPALVSKMLGASVPVVLHDKATGEVFETLAVQGDGERATKTLELVARGIHLNHFGGYWEGSLRVVPEFFRWLNPAEGEWNSSLQEGTALAEGVFAGARHHGENPEVFSYQVVDPGPPGPVVIRMHFYGGSKAVAIFGPTGG